MRISDWSSDVCSSDLGRLAGLDQPFGGGGEERRQIVLDDSQPAQERPCPRGRVERPRGGDLLAAHRRGAVEQPARGGHSHHCRDLGAAARLAEHHHPSRRSEEHTSELQSLMRISYAVFCLKKKKTNT